MYELKAVNSVRNHPAAPTYQSSSQVTKTATKRSALIDPSMT